MSSFYQSVIGIISKPCDKRKDEEIHMILAWFINLFKKKSSVFGDIKSEVVKDIIKNCSFETKNKDELIIRQGDVGDCFYINLRGKVSIYINHKRHDEADTNDDVNTSINTSFSIENQPELDQISLAESLNINDSLNSSISSSLYNVNKVKRLREKLGNYVTSLGAGEGFGEIALVSDDFRSASIIADETTDLMVVNKALYARCLQATTLRKLAEKRNFINNSPFFGNWAPKMKKLLSLCLERDIVPYDSYLGKQGELAEKMFFIISGQAKIIVNPLTHKDQYPKLYPLKLPDNEGQEIISSWIEEKKQLLHKSTNSRLKLQNITTNIGIKRRNETFAEAEHRLKIRNIEVGILGPGEITGMCELIFDMPTYMHSTRCLEDCDVYYIFKRSYERLIAKRNPFCINKMKENVHMKLTSRNRRLKMSNPIDLYRSIQFNIELSSRKQIANDFGSSSSILRNNLPRGPVIKLTTRPKSNAYLQARRISLQQNNNEILPLNFDRKHNFNSSSSLDLNQLDKDDQHFKQDNSEIQTNLEEKQHLIFNDLEHEIQNDVALVDLESRMKKWHLDLGCRKAFVPKLNRIDIDKIKKDVKEGGNVFVKRSNSKSKQNTRLSNNNNRSRTRSNSDIDSNSSSENTSTENEHDLFANTSSIGLANFLRHGNSFSTESKFFNALSRKLLPFDSQTSDFNSNLLNNLMAYIDTDAAADLNNHKLNLSALNSCNNMVDEISLLPQTQLHPTEPSLALFVPSCVNNVPKKSNPCRKTSVHSVHNLDLNKSNELNESKIVNNDSSVISDQSKLKQRANDSVNSYSNSSSKAASASLRKKSMPNIVFLNNNHDNSRRQSLDNHQAPYCVSRKFSMGQIKIQHTGKQYSKEEYVALKDELKKQSRRYSVSSAHS